MQGDTDAFLNAHWGQYQPDFPILAGCGSLYASWATGHIPYTVILDPDGIVRGNWGYWNANYEAQMHAVVQTWLPDLPMVSDLSIMRLANQIILDWTPLPEASAYSVYHRGSLTDSEQFLLSVAAPPLTLDPGGSPLGLYRVRAVLP
ncbi:MAG: hypothetical protein KC518_00115 [Candidatus Cloacimonetes bacterium]|nr:hypothetical protein [Candidatus Cloacimonadota bacterium]